MNSKKILVTGADGFIGSHLTELLVRRGFDVTAFCYYNSFGQFGWLDSCSEDVMGQFRPVLGDVRDPLAVRGAVKGVDIVLHLAALIGIPYSYVAPYSYVDTNVTGTLNVLEAVREYGVSRMVHTSTSETYGSAQFVPITEEHPLVGQSPYSASKIGADQMAISYYRSFETPVAVMRPFNTYGPRQSARAVIPTIISQALHGEGKVKLGSLEPTRDFNFVEDIARGFMMMGLSDAGAGEVINFGSNFEVSVGQVVKIISEVTGRDIEVVLDNARVRPRDSEVDRLWACNKKAKSLVGWEPRYGGLEGFRMGIKKTVEWFSDPANLAHYKTSAYSI
ncbi:NAD-dependent 4,6-dehydratase LegB [Thalassospira sp. GO-4]|jgi:dTDP-glucose 4,6-dehydratase|uniref:NAD-dependent 4,6-dehydratase LegB n=1 Tax=Thalassospira sp. GO-4 TaxID=2946605 RepID=UPI0020244EEC|nr:NAD-dependent 4,6-dehydratase LegB [Thalassospira sp. GO-4]URK17348.1 NAD-dependent 4,6-dehydratase LegB [Thalassospira sp. GO-4]